jgi:hypothetical protein
MWPVERMSCGLLRLPFQPFPFGSNQSKVSCTTAFSLKPDLLYEIMDGNCRAAAFSWVLPLNSNVCKFVRVSEIMQIKLHLQVDFTYHIYSQLRSFTLHARFQNDCFLEENFIEKKGKCDT